MFYNERQNQYLPFGREYLSMANKNDFPNIYFLDDRNRVYSYPHPLAGNSAVQENIHKLQSVANNIMGQKYPEQYRQLQNYLNQIYGGY